MRTDPLSQVHATAILSTNKLSLGTKISRPTMASKGKRKRDRFSPYASYRMGGKADPDGQQRDIVAWAGDRTSQLAFMHDTGFPTIFKKTYTVNMVIL